MSRPLRVFLVDDEPLAIKRLARLLGATGRASVVGTTTDPEEAIVALGRDPVDALFLDIHMPGMTGFELLERLGEHPPVVFTTAYDEYALRAFDVLSVDYLLKPIEAAHLDRALGKLERLRQSDAPRVDARAIAEALASIRASHLERVASRVGDRIHFVDVDRVTHFYASDKLTYAATDGKAHPLDLTIADLEARLDPARFVRVHRSAIVNVRSVREIVTRFAGRMVVRLDDAAKTELPVSRDRARAVRERLGF